MDLRDAQLMALELIRAHAPEGTYFAWSHRTSALGDYKGSLKRIRLSMRYTRTNSPEVVKDIILHEIAHARAGVGAGHGDVWKKECNLLGCVPEACKDVDFLTVQPPSGGVRATCPRCATTHWRARMPTKRYSCGKCVLPTEPRGYKSHLHLDWRR